MTDRPIIFSAPMVRALLDGRKTMTRRLVTPQPKGNRPDDATWAPDSGFKPDKRVGQTWALHSPYLNDTRLLHATCKVRHQPGDRLWVRENYRGPYAYEVNGYKPKDWGNKPIWYPADGDPPEQHKAFWWPKSRPSIHMPRWASRLTLTVTAVRVERLQEISAGDAIREGVAYPPQDMTMDEACEHGVDPRGEFRLLWGSLHGPESWPANPEVVAITFDAREGNIDD